MRRPSNPAKVGRPGINDLPAPPLDFDPAQSPKFESKAAASDEDRSRARMLRRRAMSASGSEATTLLTLADAIDPDETRHPTSPASARYMRAARIRIIGSLWELIGGQ